MIIGKITVAEETSFADINYRSKCYIIDRTKILENQGFRACLFYFIKGIPYRTVHDWEAEKRELPEYLLRLLKYRAETECLIKRMDD